MEFVSIDRIFSKLIRDTPLTDPNESDILEWTGEALEFINAIKAKQEAIAFMVVSNYQCDVPSNLHNIIQIARNNFYETEVTDGSITEVLNPEVDIPIALDENGMPVNAYDIAYYRPYFDLQYEYSLWRSNSTFQRCYSPVRLTNHSFFNSIVCSEDDTDCGITGGELYHNTQNEYTIIDGKVLRFNFPSGLVAISYLRNRLDENGAPMIPDDISFTSAIIAYIMMRHFKREFYLGREGASQKVQLSQQDWNWYVKQASTKSLIPNGIDELQNLVEQRNYLIPRRNAYANYFGNLNNREIKNIIGK
jgi:hypothetical protein